MKHTIKRIFEVYDSKGNGTISKESMVILLTKLVPNLPPESASKLVYAVDTDDDGVISYHEFLDYIFSFRQPRCLKKLFESVEMPDENLPDDDQERNKNIFQVLMAADANDTVQKLKGYSGNYRAALALLGFHRVNDQWFETARLEICRRYELKDTVEDVQECRLRDMIFLGFAQQYMKLWNAQFLEESANCKKDVIRGTNIPMIVTAGTLTSLMYNLGVPATTDSTVEVMRDTDTLPASQRRRLLKGQAGSTLPDGVERRELVDMEVKHLTFAATIMRRRHCFTHHEAACLLHLFNEVPKYVSVLDAIVKVAQWMGFKSDPEELFAKFQEWKVPHYMGDRSQVDAGIVLGLFRMCFTFEEEHVHDFLCSGGHCQGDHNEISPFILELLQNFGYSLTPYELAEALEGLETSDKNHLKENDFWHLLFMLGFRQGFHHGEIAVYCEAFERFSRKEKGLLNRSELNRAVRYLGISPVPVSTTDIEKFMTMVDLSETQTIDALAFLRLLRLCRESMFATYERIFRTNSHDFHVGYPPQKTVSGDTENLRNLLGALGYAAGEEHAAAALCRVDAFTVTPGERLDFFTFSEFVDAYRIGLAMKMQKQALFSDEEVEELRKLFDKYDEDHSGEITPEEQRQMLEELFPDSLHDPEKHKQVERLMREVDVNQAEGQVGTNLDIEEFLWLCHHRLDILSDEQHKKEVEVIMSCGYSPVEVEAFREIFMRSKGADAHAGDLDVRIPEHELIELVKRAVVVSENELIKIAKTLLDVSPERGVDFAEFLKIMRELQNLHFGGVKQSAKMTEQQLHKLEEAIALTKYAPAEVEELQKIYEAQEFSGELQAFLANHSVVLSETAAEKFQHFLAEIDEYGSRKLDLPEFILFLWRVQDASVLSLDPDIVLARTGVQAALNHTASTASNPSSNNDSGGLPGTTYKAPVVGRKGRKGRRAKAC